MAPFDDPLMAPLTLAGQVAHAERNGAAHARPGGYAYDAAA